MNTSQWFVQSLCIILLLAAGCKSTQKLTDNVPQKPKSAKFLQKKLLANQVQAEWLSAKARVTVRDGKEVRKFTSYIRWQKDSVLWMNFKKVSVEAARIKITPDSVFIIDRMNKQFVAEDFNYAQKNFDLPTNFDGLQAMLLGNSVFFGTGEMESDIHDNLYRLTGKTDTYLTGFWIEATTFLLRKMMVEDYRNGRKVTYEFSDYEKNNNQDFAHQRELRFDSEEFGDISVKVELSKVDLTNPVTIRFDIPEHYEQIIP